MSQALVDRLGVSVEEVVTKTIKDTLTYVKPEAPVEKVVDTPADVDALPVGDTLKKVEAEILSDMEANPVVKMLRNTLAKNRGGNM